jgi:isocitrate dehydrogenase
MLNYKIKKWKVYFKNYFSPSYKFKENEYLARKVIIKILSQKDTKYYMTPSGRYYMQTGDKSYTILLAGNMMKITNHQYIYEANIHPGMAFDLAKLVKKAIEYSCREMEKNIFINERNMLIEILSK